MHNLPRQLTSFVGREKEIEQVVWMVREHPLVTVTGAGGVGKTRLALQVANKVLDDFSDGVWWVDLSPVIEPVFVPITIASIFGIHSDRGERLSQILRQYFTAKHLLLILDNCEHVINEVAELSISLLEACPKINILSTSRETLGIEGEYCYRCPSLSLPEPATEYLSTSMLQRAEASEAARLFANRAAAALPTFQLSEENSAEVVAICRQLDGIPLAIELAAARLRVLSLAEIVRHLQDVFGLLGGSRRSVLPRHQTLKALLEWSYMLLNPLEQILFQRLSVFTGGWTIIAAEAVACGDGVEPGAVLDLTQQLVDKSLIFVKPTEFGQSRYSMLETIRQFAVQKIQEAGEYGAARDRHLAFFAQMLEQEVHPLDPHYLLQFEEANRLMYDLDNVRLALARSLETDIEQGLRLCLSYINVIPFHLYLEFGNWLERLLEAQNAGQGTPQSNFLRGVVLVYTGESSYLWGQRSRSEHALLESLSIFDAIGEIAADWRAYAQMSLGTLLICTDPEKSRLVLEAERETFRAMDTKPALAYCDRVLAAVYLLTGEIARAS